MTDRESSSSGWLLLLGMALLMLPKKSSSDLPIIVHHTASGWEKGATIAHITIAVGTLFALLFTAWQTKLLRDQIMGTDAAKCYVGFSIDPDAPTTLRVSIGNTGKVFSPHVEVHYTAQQEAGWPKGDKIGSPSPVEPFPVEQLGNSEKEGAVPVNVEVPGLSLDNIQQRKETLVLDGRYTYNDGFGNWRTTRDCERAMARRVGDGPDGKSGLYEGIIFLPCDKVNAQVASWQRLDDQLRKNLRKKGQ